MIQAKFSLKESHIQFIEQCNRYGFKDKSDVVRTAIDRLFAELTEKRLPSRLLCTPMFMNKMTKRENGRMQRSQSGQHEQAEARDGHRRQF